MTLKDSEQKQEMNIIITKVMKNKPGAEKVIEYMKKALKYFPEFRGKTIELGYSSNGGGLANPLLMKISIDPESKFMSMELLGHELTHLLQKHGLNKVPSGEVTCDIWTIARHEDFLDKPPTYLNIPVYMIEDWKTWKYFVRKHCIEAIKEYGDSLRFIHTQRAFTDKIRDDAFREHRNLTLAEARKELEGSCWERLPAMKIQNNYIKKAYYKGAKDMEETWKQRIKEVLGGEGE